MSLKRALSTFALLLAAPLAQAGYFQWEMVELPADTGAACGDGSPYRFFVNRTPLSKDIVITYEGAAPAGTRRPASAKATSPPPIRTASPPTTCSRRTSPSAW